MTENELNDKNTNGTESQKTDGNNSSDTYTDNPYAEFINRDTDRNAQGKESDGSRADDKSSFDRENEVLHDGFADTFTVIEENLYSTDSSSAFSPMIDQEREKKNFSRIGMGYMLFSLISTAAAWIIQFAVMSLNRELLDNMLFRNLLSPVCLYLFALPILLIMLSGCETKAPERKKFGTGKFILFVITAFGFMYLGALIGNSFMDSLSRSFGYDYSNGLESIIDPDKLWLTAIFTVIVAPIGEEFVFRKLLIDRTQKYGAFVSIGLSGLLFGLMHGNFYQFFYAFALGLLLGYIYYHSGKLYLTVLIHAFVNFVGSVLTALLSPVAEGLGSLNLADTDAVLSFLQENIAGILGLVMFDIFVYGAMACAVIFPIVFRKKLSFPKGDVAIPKKELIPTVILNAGIIAMLILYLFEFALNIFMPLL